MPASYPQFVTQRAALAANVSVPCRPPFSARTVEIGNAGSDDLKVYSTDGDETSYFVVSAGYAKVIDLKQWRFDTQFYAFYLKSALSGTAVLIWT